MEHLKPPEALILSVETNNAEAWRRWKMSWGPYKVSSGLDQKDENIQVATLLHVLGKEWMEFFSNFVWDSEDDRDKIEAVEEKFKAHCAPLTRGTSIAICLSNGNSKTARQSMNFVAHCKH